jgi:glycosyltransferase involved in cell wall biosynthesis
MLGEIKLFIYPNYAIQKSVDGYKIESSYECLLNPLLEERISVTIVGQLDELINVGNFKHISMDYVNFLILKTIKSNFIFFEKFINYVQIIFNIFCIIKKSSLNYIFLPGNVGLITAYLSYLLKHPYAIYYRGDWDTRTPRIFRSLKDVIFKNANFIVYVGAKNDRSLDQLNERTELVVPMLSVPIRDYGYKLPSTFGEKFSILFVGEIRREKGVYELVNSLKILHAKGLTQIHLTLVGSGAEFDEVENLISDMNLQKNVRLLGKINSAEELEELYRNHNLFCLPSHSEGFPRVLYEAMMFSMPIITTSVGQIQSMMIDNYNSIFVRSKDALDLENKINCLYENVELQRNLAFNAYESIYPFLSTWENKTHGSQLVSLLNK